MKNKIKNYFYDYLQLSKFGIVIFALISATAGLMLASYQATEKLSLFSLLWLWVGLWFVISGSFALNQSMEWQLDSKMNRTKKRPIPSGRITTLQAILLAILQITWGLTLLLALNPLTAFLSFLALVLYNVFYTLFWKKNWVFAAVPGALPGALPVMIGYSVISSHIFSIECLYLFFVLFLWQMPHFWSLALHYRKDYQKAGIPVLPVSLGLPKTMCHISFYLLAYLGLVLISPLVFQMNVFYIVFLIPFCIKVFMEFLKFSKAMQWKSFFIWLNLSVLVFLWVPLGDLFIYSMFK